MRLTISQQYSGIHTLPVGAELIHCLQGFSEGHRNFRFMPIGAPGALLRGNNTVFNLRTLKLHMLGEKRLHIGPELQEYLPCHDGTLKATEQHRSPAPHGLLAN